MQQGKAGDIVGLKNKDVGFTDPDTAFDISRDQEKALTDPIGARTQAAIAAGGLIITDEDGNAVDKTEEAASEFEPLSQEETQRRIEEGDESPEVLKSLAHYIRQGRKELDERRPPPVDPNPLPADMPGREVFFGVGLSLEEIQAMATDADQVKGKAALVAIKGIGEKTADAVLAYFAPKE